MANRSTSFDFQAIPTAAYIVVGMAVLGLGIGISGMAGCEARSTEAKAKLLEASFPSQIEDLRRRQEDLRWQLEKGIISKERYASEMLDPAFKKLFSNHDKPATQP